MPGAKVVGKAGRRASKRPIVIAHRGASGYVPEHTLVSYFIAIQQGADFIEPDLVMTRDGVLVARHENEIGGTTDVAEHTEFQGRRTAKVVDGEQIEGWFTEDFTLAELKSLHARERIAELRPANSRFDGQFEIPSLEEILALARGVNRERAARARRLARPAPRPIGVYPETKHPSYFRALGLPMEAALLAELERGGFGGARAPVFIQSFEVANLVDLRLMTRLPLVQLIEASGRPFDFSAQGDARSYADLISPAGLAAVANYADAIGVDKSLIIPRLPGDELGVASTLVADAHRCGLAVHGWTFRAENAFLPKNLRSSAEPSERGNLAAELAAFLATGIDGFFADQSDVGVEARDLFVSGRAPVRPSGV